MPYMRMPVLYILAAIQVIRIKVPMSKMMEMTICQMGTPNGILTIMEIGEVKGIMDRTTDKTPSGLLMI